MVKISSPQKTNAPVKSYLGSKQTYVGDFSAPLEIKGSKALVKFRTGPVYSGKPPRFKLRIEGKSCNKVQIGSGTITSPGWPENYTYNDKCKYTLNAEPGKIIKLVFDEFDVESAENCKYDSLTIMGQKYCGKGKMKKAPKKDVMIYAESTELLWSSDDSYGEKGFSFSWKSVDIPIQILKAVESAPLESAAGFNAEMEVCFMVFFKFSTSKISPKMVVASQS